MPGAQGSEAGFERGTEEEEDDEQGDGDGDGDAVSDLDEGGVLVHEVADVGPEVDFEAPQAEREGFPAGGVDFVLPFEGRLGREADVSRCVENPWGE